MSALVLMSLSMELLFLNRLKSGSIETHSVIITTKDF